MAIPESFIQEVVLRNPLEEIVAQYATLKRAGNNMVCCCPFHNEKTPSFTLYAEPSHFYCYGCGAGGDVITFIRRMENLDYVSAIEFLARRAGLPMPESDRVEKRIDKKRYYDMNARAARLWHEYLLSPEGAVGLKYLQGRGLTMPIIRRFGLGYAPLSWDFLTSRLLQEGYQPEEIRDAFLGGIGKTGKVFDYFRGRAMFPIIDAAGNVVAFSGRLVESDRDDNRKYFNSNDTPVFKKSRNVFALNLAKNSPEKELILCEGNMDAVSLHAHGFSNAVASLGTALTGEQCRLLSRYTQKVALCYDADEAGQRATKKAIRLLQEVGIKVRVITLSGKDASGKEVKDPDDFVRAFGKGGFEKFYREAPGAIEYLFSTIRSRHTLDTMDGKDAFVKDCTSLLSEVASPLERELYISRIAELTNLPAAIIRAQTGQDVRKQSAKQEKERLDNEIRRTQGLGNRINPDKAKFTSLATKEEGILGILLVRPEYLLSAETRARVESAVFSCDFCRRVRDALLEATRDQTPLNYATLNEPFSPDEIGELEGLKIKRSGLGNQLSVLEELLDRLAWETQRSETRSLPLGEDWLQSIKKQKNKETNSR